MSEGRKEGAQPYKDQGRQLQAEEIIFEWENRRKKQNKAKNKKIKK